MTRQHTRSLLTFAFLAIVTLFATHLSASTPAAHDCVTNAQCASTDYCAKAVGMCSGPGTCTPRPTICPDICGVGASATCGCDGRNYCNSCFAAQAGVNVAHNGAC